MDSEDYIANIHAHWRHSQKDITKKLDKATASKSQQSKLCSSKSSLQPQLYDDYDQCLDYVGDNDDENPRNKGKKSKEPLNEWYDECDKPPRHKKKDRYAEAYWDPNDDCYDHYNDFEQDCYDYSD